MSQLSGARAQVHRLKVTLQDFRPTVWRRLEVPSEVTLAELSDILQDAFGWEGDHLHKFVVANVEYVPELLLERRFLGPPGIGEDSVGLVEVAPRPGAILAYTYDLGDEWRHRIEVEDIVAAEPDMRYPICTAGRGVAPEEDSSDLEYTPGTFTEDDRLALNRRFRSLPGRELPAPVRKIDPVFAALFPWLVHGEGEERALRPRQDAPADELAAQATASPLMRRAVALARWVGSGRALTPGKVLRPDEAVQAVADLGLDHPLLPKPSWESPWRRADEPASGDRVRSAKDLPVLHGLWRAAVEAGLIEVHGSKAVAADGAGEGDPVELWARLLAGLMRARVQAEQDDRSYYGRQAPQEAVFPITAQLLDEFAERPLPILLPALPVAAATGDMIGLYGLSDLLFGAVHAAMSDWALAGVIARTDDTTAPDVLESTVEELVLGFWQDDDPSAEPGAAAHEFLCGIPRPTLDTLYAGASVRLSPLGAYGVRRLLVAHGSTT